VKAVNWHAFLDVNRVVLRSTSQAQAQEPFSIVNTLAKSWFLVSTGLGEQYKWPSSSGWH
jgi:hypothetical protein